MEKKQSTEGEPMFVESLMTKDEWNQRMKDFPNTSHNHFYEVNRHKTNNFKWRYRMGLSLTAEEIDNIYRGLDYLKRKFKSQV